MAWEIALLVQVGWACAASADGISARLYPFIWLPRHVMTSFEYSVLYALETGISILIGGYAIGWLADRIGRRKVSFPRRGGEVHVIMASDLANPRLVGEPLEPLRRPVRDCLHEHVAGRAWHGT